MSRSVPIGDGDEIDEDGDDDPFSSRVRRARRVLVVLPERE